jgi:hypothetical protein
MKVISSVVFLPALLVGMLALASRQTVPDDLSA